LGSLPSRRYGSDSCVCISVACLRLLGSFKVVRLDALNASDATLRKYPEARKLAQYRRLAPPSFGLVLACRRSNGQDLIFLDLATLAARHAATDATTFAELDV
jgi:hypothetical protein